MLQQTTAPYPFMRQSILFADIAKSASNHQITWVIGTTFTGKRDNVIDLMLSPFDLFAAIVAFAFLPFIVSSLRGALTPLGHTTFLPPHSTTNPPVKQRQGVYSHA